jgi:ATP-dependent protease ClpP protease subunit
MRNFIVRATVLLAVLSFFGVMPVYAGQALDMTGPRTVRVSGVVGMNAIDVANKIERLSAESKEDINLIINSPGGSVPAGMQVVESIAVAKARGVTVRCAVTVLAASMAFSILNECSERYALNNSLLLFHPARAMIMGALKSEDARYIAEELDAINAELIDKLELSFGVATNAQKEWMLYHFKNETLWSAGRLVKEIPTRNWLTIVEDIQAEGSLFGSPTDRDVVDIKNFLQERGAL